MKRQCLLFVFILCLAYAFCIEITKIREACEEVNKADDVMREHLDNPLESNCEQIFDDFNTYFTKTDKLIECLKEDKNRTIAECKETIMEGEPRFMITKFDYWKLMNGFKWNMTQVEKYMDWRDKVLYLWQRVDEASGRNSVYPKLA